MFSIFKAKADPAAAIGPDGMTDFSREMHRQWVLRDKAMDAIHAKVAERTGIAIEAFDYMPSEYIVLALLLADDLKPIKKNQDGARR